MLFQIQKPVYVMLCVDPGSNKTGVSVFWLEAITKKIIGIKSWTIHIDKLKNDTGMVEDLFPDREIRYAKLCNAFRRILEEYEPMMVSYEGPFMNRFQPSAYGPLVAVMTSIQKAVVEFNQGIPFLVLQPQQCKKAVGVAGKKGKGIVKEAVAKLPDIVQGLRECHCELDDLDEHAIDSLAVGVAALNQKIF